MRYENWEAKLPFNGTMRVVTAEFFRSASFAPFFIDLLRRHKPGRGCGRLWVFVERLDWAHVEAELHGRIAKITSAKKGEPGTSGLWKDCFIQGYKRTTVYF